MIIITPERIRALSNISRWYGWVKRPFSVLDHTLVGFYACQSAMTSKEQARAWLLHDMHETHIMGDVSTPDKNRYLTLDYDVEVREFDEMLCDEAGLGTDWRDGAHIKRIDRVMLLAEHETIVSGTFLSESDMKLPSNDIQLLAEAQHMIQIHSGCDVDPVKRWSMAWQECI